MKNFFMKNINVLCLLLALCCIVTNSNAQCEDAGNYWNKSWVSCEKTLTPNPARSNPFHWLQYEFDEAQSIDSIQIWNANRTGESTMGARNIRVDYSVDGTTWITNAVNIDIPQATEQDDYEGFQFPSNFENVFVKNLLIVIRTNYGDANCASIGEVRFNINSDACYGIVDECGECDGPGASTWYMDADGDGLGSPSSAVQDCNQPTGFVANPDDYCDNGLVGWNEVGAIFADNGCTGCHGMGSSGGLKLDTYANAVLGGNKCGPNILTGNSLTQIITTAGYAGCGTPLNGQSMNSRVGGQVDAAELALLQTWIDAGAPEDCNCLAGAPDADGDGTCDAIDDCPTFDNSLIGTPCDDGFTCTENDTWDSACNCTGIPRIDTDNDGVCDAEDAAPNDPCTADGIIDGAEPTGWIALPTNDCDTDGINNQNGDLNDFAPCINNYGTIKTAACQCPSDAKIGSGRLIGEVGVGSEALASGLPDGLVTGSISGANDYIQLEFPEMPAGEEICFTVGFSDINGTVNFSINNNSFTYPNPAGLDSYQLQEICIQVRTSGVQDVFIRDAGSGTVKVDGSTYNYCECSQSDPKYTSPDCTCAYEGTEEAGQYLSSVGIVNPERADGAPDGTFSNGISGSDSLYLTYPNITPGAEICVAIQFSQTAGTANLFLGNETLYAVNADSAFAVQEFCFINKSGITDLLIKDAGTGYIRVDGSTVNYCPDCNSTPVKVYLHAWLEGNYAPATQAMTTTLNQRGLLPGQTPISALATPTPAGQPYSTAPWNYTGTEGVGWSNNRYIGTETDWVLVSFRTGTAKSTEVAMTAALLQSDGSILFPNTCLLPIGSTALYIVIEHRNHIGIMTPQAVQIQNNTLTYDFRVNNSYRDPTSFGQKQTLTGEWVMYAGDANQIVDIASYDITGTDKAVWFENNGVFDYYLSPDFNLDGDVNGQDKSLWFENNGISSRVPK